MIRAATERELRHAVGKWRGAGQRIGLVPTMGALHAGHASLIRRAASECDCVCTTIFVNPMQFGAGEDLTNYPRSLASDILLADESGASIVLAPSVEEMYGSGMATTVAVTGAVAEMLEADSRRGHFDGVATVVAKLFAIVGACHAYFGEKDFQQLAVVRQMVRDLSIPVEVVGCPTVRDPDGLALSSRNAYLTPEERAAAPVVHAALEAGRAAVLAGETDPAAIRALMAARIDAEPLAELDYAEIVDAATFAVSDPLRGTLRLLAAARFGKARLIDNVGVELPGPQRA
jgi:pantoate--beta-alanine ligase